jgi:hypothetical protein
MDARPQPFTLSTLQREGRYTPPISTLLLHVFCVIFSAVVYFMYIFTVHVMPRKNCFFKESRRLSLVPIKLKNKMFISIPMHSV